MFQQVSPKPPAQVPEMPPANQMQEIRPRLSREYAISTMAVEGNACMFRDLLVLFDIQEAVGIVTWLGRGWQSIIPSLKR